MNQRKLPRAITRAVGELPPMDAVQHEVAPLDRNGASTTIARSEGIEDQPPSRQMLSEEQTVPRIERPIALRQNISELEKARRRAASSIIERYATYSAGGGIIPLPVLGVASVTAINVRMVRLLSNLYGVPFERERARVLVAGLAAGAMPVGLAGAAASVLPLIPASGIVVLAISSVTAVVFTRAIGRLFVASFETGTTPHDLLAS